MIVSLQELRLHSPVLPRYLSVLQVCPHLLGHRDPLSIDEREHLVVIHD